MSSNFSIIFQDDDRIIALNPAPGNLVRINEDQYTWLDLQKTANNIAGQDELPVPAEYYVMGISIKTNKKL